MRIFVDVEDTLLLNPAGVNDPGECTEPNELLMAALFTAHIAFRAQVIVWSSAGPGVAKQAAFDTLPKAGFVNFLVCTDKDWRMTEPDDIVIDDTEFKSYGRWVTPREFIRYFGNQN